MYLTLSLALLAAVIWVGARAQQKAPTYSQDSLTRRPVELNHTPSSGANWLSSSDQSRLVSASSYLRDLYAKDSRNKNNIPISEDAAFGFADGDATLLDNHLKYITSKDPVKRSVDNFPS